MDFLQIYRLFSEFIQTKKRYPTSLVKTHIITQELTPCKLPHICRCALMLVVSRSHLEISASALQSTSTFE